MGLILETSGVLSTKLGKTCESQLVVLYFCPCHLQSSCCAAYSGSSSGIGAETAACFAARGAKVVITGRRQAGLDETAQRCLDAGATIDDILLVKGDITDKATTVKITNETVAKFGRIDILINNVGGAFLGDFEDTSEDDIWNMYNKNTVSMFNMTKMAMPWLVKTRGSVVNVSSICGLRVVSPLYLAYSMAKAAVDQFSKCLAVEYAARGVRINVVNPGHTNTPALRNALEKLSKELSHNYPMQRIAEVSEVANAILFLASDQSSFTTGAQLAVSGGLQCCIQGALV